MPQVRSSEQVVINLDLSSPYETHASYDGEEEIQVSLGEALTGQLVRYYTEKIGTRVELDVRDKTRAMIAEVTREKVEALVTDALSKPMRKTNGYGDPIGPETTLNEVLTAEIKKFMVQPSGDSYGRNGGLTPLAILVKQYVENVLAKEMRAAAEQAQKAAVQAVQAKAAEFLATEMERVIKRG